MLQIILTILGVLLGVLLVLLIIALIHTAAMRTELKPVPQSDMSQWLKNKDIYATHLSQMIQVPTVSRRGNKDMTTIYQFHRLIERLYPKLHAALEKKDIDGALLFKWKGSNPSLKPILLMSHMDVVEAGGDWGAFDGEISGGAIWGRGSVDTKGALCAILESVEYLLGEGVTPACDVYIASSNNEEITGDGAVKTVDYLQAQGITLGLVMDEGGAMIGSPMPGMEHDLVVAMVGILEKGRANVKFTAESTGGHASIPQRNTPIARLAAFVNRIEKRPPFKHKFTQPVKQMYHSMAHYMHFPFRFILGNLWLFGPLLKLVLPKMGGQANAMIASTCVFTMAQGSNGANVIPMEASVTANMRFMTHQRMGPSINKVAKIARKYDISTQIISGYDVCNPADTNSYEYKYVLRRIRDTFGEIPISPYVMLAGTDSRHYTRICNCVLRFVPLIMTNEQMKSAHGIGENLDVDSLAKAVGFYAGLIKNYTGPQQISPEGRQKKSK